MGYTFTAALMQKPKGRTAASTRKVFREAMKSLGYHKAASAADAPISFRMYQDKKSNWLSLAMDMPEDLSKETAFLRTLAAEMHTPILYFLNFDSDFLYVAATDGTSVQHVHVGFVDDEDEAMTDSDDLSIFDALLPDDAARAEFRRILAVDMEERVFSETAAQEMAALFGYAPEVLFVDEDAEPFAELNFNLPGEAVPFLMPEDAPPAFTKNCARLGWGNPISMRLNPCGGVGKGIRVLMKADGYDADDWTANCVQLSNAHNKNTGHPAPQEYTAKAVPQRVHFQDGGKGWQVDFPEAPIFRGVNPDSPMAGSMRADMIYHANGYELDIVFTGGTFRSNDLVFAEKTHIWAIPMENPDGLIYHSCPRQFLHIVPRWVEAQKKQNN